MFTVYVLYSPKYDKIYIGVTSNIQQRMISHNQLGKKGWTIRYRPWQIVHTELFQNKQQALKREKELKSAKGRAFVRTLIASGSYRISFKSCGLSIQFGQSEQEEIDISDTSELTSEGFYLRIE